MPQTANAHLTPLTPPPIVPSMEPKTNNPSDNPANNPTNDPSNDPDLPWYRWLSTDRGWAPASHYPNPPDSETPGSLCGHNAPRPLADPPPDTEPYVPWPSLVNPRPPGRCGLCKLILRGGAPRDLNRPSHGKKPQRPKRAWPT